MLAVYEDVRVDFDELLENEARGSESFLGTTEVFCEATHLSRVDDLDESGRLIKDFHHGDVERLNDFVEGEGKPLDEQTRRFTGSLDSS